MYVEGYEDLDGYSRMKLFNILSQITLPHKLLLFNSGNSFVDGSTTLLSWSNSLIIGV